MPNESKSNCFEVRRPDGSSFTWPIGSVINLQQGEKIVGRADECYEGTIVRYQPNLQPSPTQLLRLELEQQLDGKLGDVVQSLVKPIAILSKKVGCSSCQATQTILNAFSKLKDKLGPIKAAKTITRLAYRAKTGHEHDAMEELKDILEIKVL